MSAEAPRAARISWWPWALVAGAVSLVVGGMLHPDQDPARSDAAGLAGWIGDPLWVPAHSLILLGSALLGLGLLGLLGHRPELPTLARRAGRVAGAAAGLWVIESVPHLLASTESPAAAAGHSTPILGTHMVLALLVYPLFGFSVAALALLSGRQLAHPAIGVLAAVGGICWGVAPWAVGPLGIEPLTVLFMVGMLLMALWFAVVGIGALVRRRSDATTRGTTARAS